MSLAEKVRAATPRSTSRDRCDVAKILPRLSQEDADALDYIIYKRLDLSGAEVSDLLAEESIDLSSDTIRRHRNNRCVGCRERRQRHGSV